MSKILKSQLANSVQIKSILNKVDVVFTLKCGTRVEVLLIYLPCKSGECDLSSLYQLIKDCIITDFALSYSEIRKKLRRNPADAPQELLEKAVRRLSQHTAQGELGELLLFTILDVYFNAPKIVSKISQKQARRMPAFGADAIHAQYMNNNLVLYLGESKLHKSYSDAKREAITSITTSLNSYKEQFDYIDSNISFPEMTEEAEEEMLDLLHPFKNKEHIGEILHTPCFIGFEHPEVFDEDQDRYTTNYIELAKKHVGDFYSRLELKGLEAEKTALLLLPFTSIDQLVFGFIDYLGIEL
ncbi:DUF1837 domain-containing protein [Halodesulfovibrio sp.]|jgi:hypothetical protein|uniref:HamA C-terminal domain-containing protein n=1 Tax=Halodesulfovibrio sp. TaxID=1912772 RepID=UPI0025F5B8CC|nr:DUF1837 domain-containing protein [Halodesulfovibrio sp.]MCT4534775.1 DUF1837 domain-containing protein [Halodesulfovibrio sp.]